MWSLPVSLVCVLRKGHKGEHAAWEVFPTGSPPPQHPVVCRATILVPDPPAILLLDNEEAVERLARALAHTIGGGWVGVEPDDEATVTQTRAIIAALRETP